MLNTAVARSVATATVLSPMATFVAHTEWRSDWKVVGCAAQRNEAQNRMRNEMTLIVKKVG